MPNVKILLKELPPLHLLLHHLLLLHLLHLFLLSLHLLLLHHLLLLLLLSLLLLSVFLISQHLLILRCIRKLNQRSLLRVRQTSGEQGSYSRQFKCKFHMNSKS